MQSRAFSFYSPEWTATVLKPREAPVISTVSWGSAGLGVQGCMLWGATALAAARFPQRAVTRPSGRAVMREGHAGFMAAFVLRAFAL